MTTQIGGLGYGAPLLRLVRRRERSTWEAMLLRKEQAAMAAPPGGRSQAPLPPHLSFSPAQGRAESHHVHEQGGRGSKSSLVPLQPEEVRRGRGLSHCAGERGGRRKRRVRRERFTGAPGGVAGRCCRECACAAARRRALPLRLRCQRADRYRAGPGRQRGDMSTCSVSKVRGGGGCSPTSAPVATAAGFVSRPAEAARGLVPRRMPGVWGRRA